MMFKIIPQLLFFWQVLCSSVMQLLISKYIIYDLKGGNRMDPLHLIQKTDGISEISLTIRY